MSQLTNDLTTTSLEFYTVKDMTILSSGELRIVKIVNFVFLSSAICLFGIFANVTNVVIFYKRGLDNTVNISLFGIALSDLGSLITAQWLSICLNPFFEDSNIPMVPSEIQYLTAGWPHVCFTRITCCITVYVTAERCTCITFPLKVKHIFTPLRTKITIITIYLLMFLSLVPEYATAYIGWKFYPPRNKTLLRLIFASSRENVQGLVFVLNATLSLLSFAAVIICTIVLVWKLRVTAKWRQNSQFYLEQFQNIAIREKKTVNMIVLIAIVLIFCYTPGTVLLLITFFVPEFSVSGKYVNIFLAAWSVGLLLEAINSGVNIFLYYNMSTRYRQTLKQLFSNCCRRKSRSLPDQENGRFYVNITQSAYVERSDSDVMYEVSTEFCDTDVPCVDSFKETTING